MNNINKLHDRAMEFFDQAFLAKRKGDFTIAMEFTRKALSLEVQAADILKDNLEEEPSRSVIYRSAASLALQCEEFRLSERLISTAMSGNPPENVAEELRDLLEQVNFKRHLKLRNIDLTSSEIQMSLVGDEVGLGTILMESFVGRVKDLERIIYRTVERLKGKDFRDQGATDRSIQDSYSLYMSAPRIGSFAVTLQLGRQMELPGIDLSKDAVDELIDCFSLVNDGKKESIEELKKKIPQESYYLNFVNLAKRIAPDGKKISMVGLTKIRDGKEFSLALKKKRKEILSNIDSKELKDKQNDEELVTVKGRLLFADARKVKGKINLIDESKKSHSIIVPEGMMDDIVKPLWDEVVVVNGIKSGNKILLCEITDSTL